MTATNHNNRNHFRARKDFLLQRTSPINTLCGKGYPVPFSVAAQALQSVIKPD
jgi:hypothetical protein